METELPALKNAPASLLGTLPGRSEEQGKFIPSLSTAGTPVHPQAAAGHRGGGGCGKASAAFCGLFDGIGLRRAARTFPLPP